MYRTDVTFGFLDLLGNCTLFCESCDIKYYFSGFEGIAGLFLGCSNLSVAELVYYIFNFVFFKFFKSNYNNSKILQKNISGDISRAKKFATVIEADKKRKNNKNTKVLRIQYIKEAENKNKFLY